MNEKNINAVLLGRMAKGKKKRISKSEKLLRAIRLAKVRGKRWPSD